MQAKKVLLSSLHEDVANKEDGGLKRMLGEDEEIAKKREASMNRLRMLEKVRLIRLLWQLVASDSWLLFSDGSRHKYVTRCVIAEPRGQYFIPASDGTGAHGCWILNWVLCRKQTAYLLNP